MRNLAKDLGAVVLAAVVSAGVLIVTDPQTYGFARIAVGAGRVAGSIWHGLGRVFGL
jgi:hypothetical protein